MTAPLKFNGKLDLTDPSGLIYNTYTQVGPISITVGDKVSKGWALVPIIANGSTITIPSNWIKYGGDDIATSGTNHLQVFYRDENIFYYTNANVA